MGFMGGKSRGPLVCSTSNSIEVSVADIMAQCDGCFWSRHLLTFTNFICKFVIARLSRRRFIGVRSGRAQLI